MSTKGDAGGRELHVVDKSEEGSRLDRIVTSMRGVGSRNRAREVVVSGKVTLDGTRCGAADLGRKLAAGARVIVDWDRAGTSPEKVRTDDALLQARLVILHSDETLLAVEKPAGLLTDTATREQARERDSVKKRLGAWMKARGAAAHVVHRLDRDTSGVILLACNDQAEAHLRTQFRRHTPERVYWAAVQGRPELPEGQWQEWMAWDRVRLIQRIVRPDVEGAVLATTHYRVMDTFRCGVSVLELKLVTGRRNQIRLHAQHHGCPLVGESLYIDPDWTRMGPVLGRQALHARRLTVVHPATGKLIRFEAALPEDLREFVKKL